MHFSVAGDPLEIGALSSARQSASGSPDAPLLIQANKSFGAHAEPAAGATGLLSIIVANTCRKSIPIMHLRAVNPYVSDALCADSSTAWAIPRQSFSKMHQSTNAVAGCSSFAYQV